MKLIIDPDLLDFVDLNNCIRRGSCANVSSSICNLQTSQSKYKQLKVLKTDALEDACAVKQISGRK